MKTVHLCSLIILLSVLQFACASPPGNLFPPGPNDASRTIYLVSHGWHAGIVVKRADIVPASWLRHDDLHDAEYLEVGWGDKDYYMTPEPRLGITLKAGLLPTTSVLHIVGFRGSVTRYFPRSEVIRIELSEAGFKGLRHYLESSFALDEAGLGRPLGPSLYGNGQFYLSRETYHAFNTCNVWTARALREAGCPITPAANLRVETLMTNAARFGTVIQTRASIP